MKNFKTTVKGKVQQLKHYSRHRANCRQVCELRHMEYMKENDIEYTKDMKIIFKTAFNLGYNHGRKRHLGLERKENA